MMKSRKRMWTKMIQRIRDKAYLVKYFILKHGSLSSYMGKD